MAQFYIRKIKDGTIKLDEVPPLWKNQVKGLLQGEQIKDREEK